MPVLTAACDICGSTVDVTQEYDDNLYLCGYHHTESALRDAKRDLAHIERVLLRAQEEQAGAKATVLALERKLSTLTKPT